MCPLLTLPAAVVAVDAILPWEPAEKVLQVEVFEAVTVAVLHPFFPTPYPQ